MASLEAGSKAGATAAWMAGETAAMSETCWKGAASVERKADGSAGDLAGGKADGLADGKAGVSVVLWVWSEVA